MRGHTDRAVLYEIYCSFCMSAHALFLRFKTFFILDEYNSVYTSFKAFAQNLVMTKTTTMTNTKTQTFRQHPQRASLETCDLKKKLIRVMRRHDMTTNLRSARNSAFIFVNICVFDVSGPLENLRIPLLFPLLFAVR